MPDFSQPLAPIVDRDDQVLRYLADYRESGRLGHPTDENVAQATGLDVEVVRAAARSLQGEGLVETHRRSVGQISFGKLAPGMNARTGLWPRPEEAVERLLAALEEAIRGASSEEQRTRLKRVREAVLVDGRALAVTLAGAALGPALGLGS